MATINTKSNLERVLAKHPNASRVYTSYSVLVSLADFRGAEVLTSEDIWKVGPQDLKVSGIPVVAMPHLKENEIEVVFKESVGE